jgi:cyclophilin family peptidyl-prolyl cis-trans isomerase
MWDRIREGRSQVERYAEGLNSRTGRRSSRQPLMEVLEDRQLLASASLQPIANLNVPSLQGYTLPLLANSGATDDQTYTVTSSNSDIAATVATGPFWNVGVSYTDPSDAANNFNGTLTFQLFQGLTPNTVSEISNLTNNGYFVNTGKYFSRVLTTGTVQVVQGGSPTTDGSEPNPPVTFANESVQQLALTGIDQLAMANSGGTDTDSSQFFITLNNQQNSALGYNYTIFGQLLTGLDTLTKMTQVPVMPNELFSPPEDSQPVNPLTISSANLTTTNPNGTLLVDTTQALPGETSTITVTATDPTSGTKSSQTFVVVVGAYAGPADPTINFRPLAQSFTATSTDIQLQGSLALPDSTSPGTLSYQIVDQPAHGTISNFNPTTGTLNYTSQPGFSGPVTFTYETLNTNTALSPSPTTSNPATVTLNVTGAVQVIGTDLVITPSPTRGSGKEKIDVADVPQPSGGSNLEVEVNGVVDPLTVPDTSITRIIAFGGKQVKNEITIDPSVTLPATISSGQGFKNRLVGGGGETREHGWFGYTTLVGGNGPNQLIGLAGHVRFRATKSTTEAFAGIPRRRTSQLNPLPPGGTYYTFHKGRLVPVIKF